jgi:hypothetical protein
MFTYFGILKTSSSDEEVLAPGIETPTNLLRQKPFFGGSAASDDGKALKASRLERDLALLDGACACEVPDSGQTQPLRFVTLFMPPYV